MKRAFAAQKTSKPESLKAWKTLLPSSIKQNETNEWARNVSTVVPSRGRGRGERRRVSLGGTKLQSWRYVKKIVGRIQSAGAMCYDLAIRTRFQHSTAYADQGKKQAGQVKQGVPVSAVSSWALIGQCKQEQRSHWKCDVTNMKTSTEVSSHNKFLGYAANCQISKG